MGTTHATPAPFQVGPRATATPGLIEVVRTAWHLGEVTEIVDLGGTYNLNLRLRIERGNIVLRVYRPWVRPDRLAFVQSVRDGLRNHGLPVETALPTAEGSRSITSDHRLLEVESWWPDDGGTDSATRNVAAAGLLGRLHTALRATGSELPLVAAPVSNALSPTDFDGWLARTVRTITDVPGSDATARALRACRDVASIARDARHITRPALPRQLVHGDYGHGNVRFSGDTPSMIVDFDFLDTGERIVDLADLAFGPHWMAPFGQLDRPPADRDWDAVARLIRQYDAASEEPLSDDEIAALPVAMAMVPLTWVAASWLQTDAVAAVNLVAPELTTAAWLLRHRGDLARIWSRGR
jgi:Ser/Thr protein kinase RdoA (MazF antagonist)